jgi:hypothetical protein
MAVEDFDYRFHYANGFFRQTVSINGSEQDAYWKHLLANGLKFMNDAMAQMYYDLKQQISDLQSRLTNLGPHPGPVIRVPPRG